MRRYQIVLLVLLLAGAAFVIYQQRTAPYQHCSGRIFGTYYNITYQHESNLEREILEALNGVDSSLSMFNAASTLARINRGEDVALDKPLQYLLPRALTIAAETDGAFDITVAPLVNVWGFGVTTEAWPTAETIDSLMTFVGYDKLSIKGKRIEKSDARTMIDLSAIAKGYAADVVAQMMERNKVRNYMVELGGDLVVKGHGSSTKAWRIGLSRPVEGDSIQAFECILRLTDCAAATSGNYRNFFYKDGVRYAHTIDPHTGYPIAQDIVSATIIAPRCYEADAYATAAMVLGLDGTKALIAKHPSLEAYLIYTTPTGEQEVWMTDGFEKYISK